MYLVNKIFIFEYFNKFILLNHRSHQNLESGGDTRPTSKYVPNLPHPLDFTLVYGLRYGSMIILAL